MIGIQAAAVRRLGWLLGLGSVLCNGGLRAERLDFTTRILPVLTKAGCNAGACHGAATGQGGFKLSLLGYDPEQDYLRITRELGGRRVDLAQPTNSLLLKKATRQIDHEGDRRIRRDSAHYELLVRWIAAGASFGPPDLRVASLHVAPSEILAGPTNSTFQLRVTATLSDGTREDVSELALYSSNDDTVAEVEKFGRVQARGPGATCVMVRYGGQVAASSIGRPYATDLEPGAFAAFTPRNFIDELALDRWQRLRLPPSPPAEDAEFLRRVSLDLTGQLPAPEEVLAFLDSLPSPTKRDRVIDRLITRAAFVDLWTLRLADLLLMSGRRGAEAGTQAYYQWLHGQIEANRPWDGMVRALLSAEGDVAEVGPANFLMLASDPRDLAEHVGTMFLGTRIGCARCHAHPADRWTQLDYYRFSAYFARVRRDGSTIRNSEHGEVEHPRTGRPLTPKPLGADSPPAAARSEDRRQELAEWLASPGNPFFARATVNRVWKHLLGRGLVEPVDDLRLTNPATNPALLDALARHFAAGGFDLRDLIRTIVSSRTYQLSSRTVPGNDHDDRFYSHALVKSPSAQVLLDMIAQATGVPESFPGHTEPTRAVQLIDTQTASYALDVLGRCPRERSCETTATAGGGLAQALHLINGTTINGRLETGLLARVREENLPNDAAVRTLYLHTLSRPPTPDEASEWNSLLAESPNRAQALEDLLWALLNSREFVFNH